jgi:hypothetical protein
MRKYVAPIIVAGILIGNLALSYAAMKDMKEESQDINVEIIEHYNYMIDFEERTKEEERIIKEGYAHFLSYVSEEYYESNPEDKPSF